MNIDIIRLLFDFGLFVLIWLVQLVIYPSFCEFAKEDLERWHKKYTRRMTIIVLPLMLGQLSLAIIQVINDHSWYIVFGLIMICLAWVSTFFQFIPTHNKISFGNADKTVLNMMIRKNWLRTILWTVIFLLSFYKCLFYFV